MNIVATIRVIAVAGALSVLGATAFVIWLGHDPTRHFVESVPGMDGRTGTPTRAEEAIRIGEHFVAGTGVVADLPGAWPRFRGVNADNISTERVALAEAWPTNGPPLLWTIPLGEGHAAPAVLHGRVYVLDYDEQKKGDALRCLSLADGSEIWRRWYKVQVKRNHGMSRTVPAVTEQYVVTIGPRCQVMCVKAQSGDFLWGLDLVKEYGTEVPGWYTGQCPLIDDGLAIIAPAGSNTLMLAVDCASGAVVWRAPNPRMWKMSHASVMPMTLRGKYMYVYCAIGGMAGVSARGADRGQVLWETTLWSKSVVAPSPLVMDDGLIYLTAGYSAGSMLVRVAATNGGYAVTKLQELKPNEGLASEQQTPIRYQGCLFAVLPKDGGPSKNEFACSRADDCRALQWTSGKENRFGLGPFIIADGKIFLLNDDGELTLLQASTNAYRQLARARIMNGRDAWGPLALAGSRLLLRDDKRVVCIDVGAAPRN